MSFLSSKVVVISLLVLVSAYMLSKYHVTSVLYLKDYIPCPYTTFMAHFKSSDGNSQSQVEKPGRVIEPEELAAHNANSDVIYLAIMGQVFDVTKGQKFYGANGGYNFFSGRDGSAAFLTGEFTEEGLTDDISNFTPHQCSEMPTWVNFYHEKYTYLGKVHGRFYDAQGNPTEALERFNECHREGEKENKENQLDREKFPPCNTRWSRNTGGFVSCAPGSGGVKREWGGVPRKYFRPGQPDHRCACIRTSGLNGDGIETGDKGDLDNPLFKVYEDCDSSATECKISN